MEFFTEDVERLLTSSTVNTYVGKKNVYLYMFSNCIVLFTVVCSATSIRLIGICIYYMMAIHNTQHYNNALIYHIPIIYVWHVNMYGRPPNANDNKIIILFTD